MSATNRPETASIIKTEQALFRSSRLLLILAGYFGLFLWVRWYEEVYGWSAGLDAFAPEFEIYWMNFLYLEISVETVIAGLLWGWLWRSRDRSLERYWNRFMVTDAVLTYGKGKAMWESLREHRTVPISLPSPREELRRNLTHLVWLCAYAWSFYFGASFFTEQDATWHQTVIRDTDFTPSHIVVFYLSYPVYIITGFGAFLYARTRVPYFAKALSVPYLLSVVGPFTILPNVGLNEWGHTFWFMEEVFVAPLHYGFVVFGWFALALCGVLTQTFSSFLFLLQRQLDPH